jgi:L,D-transpeptidase catalytic domain
MESVDLRTGVSPAARQRVWLRRALLASVAVAVMAGSAVQTAAAHRRSEPATPVVPPAKDFGELPKGPLQLVVSIPAQHVTLYAGGTQVAQGGVSSGMEGKPTPRGVFSIIEKDRYHHSNIYSGAPMPFMQRITLSGIALHEGVLPGYPASHGCIRMGHDFAAKLWLATDLGVRVVVSPYDDAPQPFSHPKLFRPKSVTSPDVPVGGADPERHAGHDTEVLIHVAQAAANTASDATAAPPAEARPVEEQAAEGLQMRPSMVAADEPHHAAADGAAQGDIGDTETTGTTPVAAPVNAQAAPPVETAPAQATDHAEQPAPAAIIPATETAPEPVIAVPVIPVVAKPLPVDPYGGPNIIPPTTRGRLKQSQAQTSQNANLAVFVSRKENRLYVRQGFVPLFEAPIVIAHPEQPLGTHVFTALDVADTGVRWNVLSIASSEQRQPSPPPRRGRDRQTIAAPVGPALSQTAAGALDRITIAPDVMERIGSLLTPGSSLVVSDQGLGRETSRHTDFIVVTQ